MTNNPNTILLLESGDLEVYQGKDPRRYYHSGYQNEGPEVLHEWLSTKRIVKMAQGEEYKTRYYVFEYSTPSYPIDVSDIVEILPDKKISHGKFAKNIDMLGYFKEPVRDDYEVWQELKDLVDAGCTIEQLKLHFTINRK